LHSFRGPNWHIRLLFPCHQGILPQYGHNIHDTAPFSLCMCTHTHIYIYTPSFLPLLTGLDHVRDDANSNRFIDFTCYLVSTIGIFFHYQFTVVLKDRGKTRTQTAFGPRIERKKITTCSYFLIQFGQEKWYILMGMGIEWDCRRFGIYSFNYANRIRKLLSVEQNASVLKGCVIYTTATWFSFRMPLIFFNVTLRTLLTSVVK
jgi:hypothetical protein